MNHFDYSLQFKKDLKRLTKKYNSLSKDLHRLEIFLEQYPGGVGVSFAVLHRQPFVCIIKARLACESLRAKFLRIIYAYKESEKRIEFIELYFKGDKEREDKGRIDEYLKSI
ncbi:hypothetical protein KJ785_00005 [Patescibacteria group bacterium]|nr:hypothetical protein [Patescibacteria group bacterium]